MKTRATRKFYAQRWTPYGWVTLSRNSLNTLATAKAFARRSNSKIKRVMELVEKVHKV